MLHNKAGLAKIAGFIILCLIICYSLLIENVEKEIEIESELVASDESAPISDDNAPISDDNAPISEVRELSYMEQTKISAHQRYQEKRHRISEYCERNQDEPELAHVNSDLKWTKDLWYDYENHLIFCQISKVSSSTWVSHLLKYYCYFDMWSSSKRFFYRLHGHNVVVYNHDLIAEGFPQEELRPETRRRIFYIRNETIHDAIESLFSFVFVREPFSRIVSSYHNKMVKDWSRPSLQHLRWMRNEILTR